VSSRVLIGGALVAGGILAALGFAASRTWHRADTGRHPTSVPIELLALEHDRDGDQFIVRGIVRNPAPRTIDGLVASVSVFDRDGGLITSGQAPVATTRLAAGAETPFVVVVAGAAGVGRYHLSFRTAAGVVPHLDRRGPGTPAGLA